jgi:hypothetical protein
LHEVPTGDEGPSHKLVFVQKTAHSADQFCGMIFCELFAFSLHQGRKVLKRCPSHIHIMMGELSRNLLQYGSDGSAVKLVELVSLGMRV